MKYLFCLSLLLLLIVCESNTHAPFEFIAGIISEFKQYDQNVNGALSKEQLTKLVEDKLKQQPINVPGVQLSQNFYKQAIVSYLLKHDKNKDGLSVHQFGQLIKKQVAGSTQSQQKYEEEQQFAL